MQDVLSRHGYRNGVKVLDSSLDAAREDMHQVQYILISTDSGEKSRAGACRPIRNQLRLTSHITQLYLPKCSEA